MAIGEFHIHTNYSDGTLDVKQVLEYVSGKRDYISITDHDFLDGSIEAYKLNGEYNVTAIIGVEISSLYSSDYEESVHILGYFKTLDHIDIMTSFLKEIRRNRVIRLYKIKDKLKEFFNIDLDVTELLQHPTITRGSIGREIIRQGYNYTTDELFNNVIGRDCKAYIPSTKISTQSAINLIHKAHGLAVLAHPTLLKETDPITIIEMGCDGIEAIYPRNKENDEEKYRELANKYNLFITGGNDFHAFNDSEHADLLTLGLDGEDLDIFIKKIEELK